MPYEVAPAFVALRARAFAFKDKQAPPGFPSGVVMETGYPEGVVTLAVLSDGSVSMFFSNGGATMGMGQQPGPAQAARQLGAIGARLWRDMPVVDRTSLPELGEAKLYVLVDGGLRCVGGRQEDFGENRLPQAPLFHAAHGVIAEIRKMKPETRE
jgi:hypothetical protein